MARDSENLKRMIVKLSEVGVKITKTKSRLEILESVKESHQISET
ncbi:Lmo0850 family protein [Jeotgalibacillus marinus]|uniref:Lmo0850 family protein n=1 Tax=Jeotgalibacillus marinus TaxID=86667 RepID=A0ABV3Q8X3_9BACL